jgi:hypothetical protein
VGPQLGFGNSDLSENVNWEPDETAGYVMGRPFGELTFTGTSLPVLMWNQY